MISFKPESIFYHLERIKKNTLENKVTELATEVRFSRAAVTISVHSFSVHFPEEVGPS